MHPAGAEAVDFVDQHGWVGEPVITRPVAAVPVTHQNQRRVLAEVGTEAAQAFEGLGDGIGRAGQPAPARAVLERLGVTLQAFGVVTLRVHADRHQADFLAYPATQLLLDLAHDRRHYRAYRGATGVYEAHHHQMIAD
ncbi:hypothetical protein D3C81_1067770 [compost metagenome]